MNLNIFLHVVVGEHDLGIGVERKHGWSFGDNVSDMDWLVAGVLAVSSSLSSIDLEKGLV